MMILLNISFINFENLTENLGSALFWTLAAYVIGQLMDSFGIRWYYLFNKFNAEIEAMKQQRFDNWLAVVTAPPVEEPPQE